MQYGDIEGLGKIYDTEGIIIPVKNECVLSTSDGYLEKLEKRLRMKWRIQFFDGPGIFVLTDQRLIFIRDPILYEKKFKFSKDRFATLADWEYWVNRSNKAIKVGAKEFVEIPYDEIEKVKNGKNYSRIFINFKGDEFRVTMNAQIGEELERLQDKDKKIQPLICFEVLTGEE